MVSKAHLLKISKAGEFSLKIRPAFCNLFSLSPALCAARKDAGGVSQ
jgi:hypothetical protein